MKRILLLATRNNGKKSEMQAILKDMNIEILNLEDIEDMPEVEEDGNSFEENAIKKAKTIASLSQYITLADDSGLVVDALGGQPGIYSARFAGPNANDEENNKKLMEALKAVEPGNRTASFECVIAICNPEGKTETVRGSWKGKIALSASGTGGFGYDPLFIPAGLNKTSAELSADEKNLISHRGQALCKAKSILNSFWG